MQTRARSFKESLAKTALGYVGAVVLQMVLFPLFGYKAEWTVAGAMTAVFTAYSFVLGYSIRRYFNAND